MWKAWKSTSRLLDQIHTCRVLPMNVRTYTHSVLICAPFSCNKSKHYSFWTNQPIAQVLLLLLMEAWTLSLSLFWTNYHTISEVCTKCVNAHALMSTLSSMCSLFPICGTFAWVKVHREMLSQWKQMCSHLRIFLSFFGILYASLFELQ